MSRILHAFVLVLFLTGLSAAQTVWTAELDSTVRFYQTTDFGTILAGTDRSLYAIDAVTGARLWRKSTGKLGQTSVTPIPSTDTILLTRDEGSRSRLELIDVLTGERIWQSEKVKGDVMQLALDPERDLLAVVMARDARQTPGDELKRKPTMHVLRLSSGDELWKRDFESRVRMMPTRFGDGGGDVDHTLDNYRPPLLLDGRLYLFYEGVTSYDAETGKERQREKFDVNEDGLALTEADPVFDERNLYVSGRGGIRAIDRRSGSDIWKADDLGTAAEMILIGVTLYVRTGGQFTRIKDGEEKEKGPFGVAAINVTNGKVLWRYKGADKGLTNFAFTDANTIVFADRDDLITIDARSGKRIAKRGHKIDKAQFVIVNESGQAVVGGRNEIAAFDPRDEKRREFWRARHTAPGRGVFRTVTGIALRAAAIYFRYGGPVMSAIGVARTGLSLTSAANSFRWSGLRTRAGSVDLTTLAANAGRNYVRDRIYSYGSLARTRSLAGRLSGVEIVVPNARDIRGAVVGRAVDRITPTRSEVEESIFERLDPARQLDRLSDLLLRRTRLAELRANHMYFYTDLAKPFDKKGLVGVNVHTGQDARFVLISDPDPRFVADEASGLVYSADGKKLLAFDFLSR